MMTRRMPALLALPTLAVAIGVISGVAAGLPWWTPAATGATGATAAAAAPANGSVLPATMREFIFAIILTKGASSLADAMMYGVFGAILSQLVMRQGIAQRIIRVAAEYAGDRKLLLAAAMTAAVALAFSSLGGLGAVIMVGSLVLPILIGSGLGATYAACLVLFAISIGGIFNPGNMGVYISLLKAGGAVADDAAGLAMVKGLALSFGSLLALATLAFLVVEGHRQGRRFAWAAMVDDAGSAPRVPAPALLTPLVPIVLIMACDWEIIPAFLAAILYGGLTTQPARLIPNITAATLEGLKDISPVLGLFIGLGMALKAMMNPLTSQILSPFITAVLPTTPVGYVAFFTLLAPLTLYRGPLNLYGLGAGFTVLILGTKLLSPQAVVAAFMAVGQIQGVSDPTNTSNVWIAQFTHTSTEDLLKRTLPYVWAFVFLALVYATFGKGVVH